MFLCKKTDFSAKNKLLSSLFIRKYDHQSRECFPKKATAKWPLILYRRPFDKKIINHTALMASGGGHFNNSWGIMTYTPKKLMTRKLSQGVVKKQTQIYTIITWQQKSKKRPVLQSKFDRNFKNFTPRKSNFWNCRSNFDCNGGVFQGCKKTKTNIRHNTWQKKSKKRPLL